jgi:hypothetical protein
MAQHDDALPLSEMLAGQTGEGIKDLLREVVRDALQGLIEEELTVAIGAVPPRADRDPHRAAQRRSGPVGVDTGRGRGPHPQGASGQLLPDVARAAPSGGSGAVGGDHDRLHHRTRPPGRSATWCGRLGASRACRSRPLATGAGA